MASKMAMTGGEGRKHWTAKEKVELLKRYLKDGESTADLSDETGVAPSMLSQWTKTLFEEGERLFERKQEPMYQRELEASRARVEQLQEVVTELATTVLELKKKNGGPSAEHGSSLNLPAKSGRQSRTSKQKRSTRSKRH